MQVSFPVDGKMGVRACLGLIAIVASLNSYADQGSHLSICQAAMHLARTHPHAMSHNLQAQRIMQDFIDQAPPEFRNGPFLHESVIANEKLAQSGFSLKTLSVNQRMKASMTSVQHGSFSWGVVRKGVKETKGYLLELLEELKQVEWTTNFEFFSKGSTTLESEVVRDWITGVIIDLPNLAANEYLFYSQNFSVDIVQRK